ILLCCPTAFLFADYNEGTPLLSNKDMLNSLLAEFGAKGAGGKKPIWQGKSITGIKERNFKKAMGIIEEAAKDLSAAQGLPIECLVVRIGICLSVHQQCEEVEVAGAIMLDLSIKRGDIILSTSGISDTDISLIFMNTVRNDATCVGPTQWPPTSLCSLSTAELWQSKFAGNQLFTYFDDQFLFVPMLSRPELQYWLRTAHRRCCTLATSSKVPLEETRPTHRWKLPIAGEVRQRSRERVVPSYPSYESVGITEFIDLQSIGGRVKVK
ncbi:Alanyl-tRNA editing protein Aarsd1, partial [Perkinsus olseni]